MPLLRKNKFELLRGKSLFLSLKRDNVGVRLDGNEKGRSKRKMSWFYHSKCLLFFVFLFVIDILFSFLFIASSSISERCFMHLYFIPTSAYCQTKALKTHALHTTYVIVIKHTGANTRPYSTQLELMSPNFTQENEKSVKLLQKYLKGKPFLEIKIHVTKTQLATRVSCIFFHRC